MERTKNEVLRSVTQTYLDNLSAEDLKKPNPPLIESQILSLISQEFNMENLNKEKNQTWRIPQTLTFSQIAQIMAVLYPICTISCAGENADTDYDLIAIYQTSGPDKGIYTTSENQFRQIARQFNYSLTSNEFKEIMLTIRDLVPRKIRCDEKDLIAVGNGIFDYKTKTLKPFTPDLIFLSKSHVNYNPDATNVNIHHPIDDTDWDVESWMESLSDDPQIVQVLWEILSAIIRPNVRWNKSAWLYSNEGNNGKGTLCELMRELCGTGAYASIPISSFSEEFLLEPLTHTSAIIVDENDVGTFIDKAANLKAVITNDVIQINRKHKSPIAYQFYGFMVQCLNEYPRVKDRSDSFYRRQLFIPMDKCFTGRTRPYIKNEYLHRADVLEYVLHKVLNTNFYELSEPDACKLALEEYKEFNDPIRQFFEELSPQFTWDLLPFSFLYDLYKSWFRENAPSGSIQSKVTFNNDIINVVKKSDEWFCPGKDVKITASNRMKAPEPLILRYDLNNWKDPTYRGNDVNQICKPLTSKAYRGLQRYTNTQIQNVTQFQTPTA